jgi:hypothetical protein
MLDMAVGGGYFYWDNAHVHTATTLQDCLAAMNIQILSPPPYLPVLAPSDYFEPLRMNTELAGIPMAHETL